MLNALLYTPFWCNAKHENRDELAAHNLYLLLNTNLKLRNTTRDMSCYLAVFKFSIPFFFCWTTCTCKTHSYWQITWIVCGRKCVFFIIIFFLCVSVAVFWPIRYTKWHASLRLHKCPSAYYRILCVHEHPVHVVWARAFGLIEAAVRLNCRNRTFQQCAASMGESE